MPSYKSTKSKPTQDPYELQGEENHPHHHCKFQTKFDEPPPHLTNPSPWNTAERLPIPGYHLEGGGQILRNSLALAALTSRPIHVYHIRKNRRDGGGLKRQHLAGANWIREACGSGKRGMNSGIAAVGNKSLFLDPRTTWDAEEAVGREEGEVVPWWRTERRSKTTTSDGETVEEEEVKRKVAIEVGSNGSAMLVFQAVFPVIVLTAARFAPYNDPKDAAATVEVPKITLEIRGGTNVSWSPSFEYTALILLPTLTRHGAIPEGITAHLEKRGWMNGGMGIVRFEIPPFLSGEGVKPIRIGDDRVPEKRNERVVKFSLTLVVPLPEELEVWEEVGRQLISELTWDEPVSEAEVEGVENLSLSPTPKVPVELTTLSLASLPSNPTPADLARTSARAYYALIQLTTTSGHHLAYDIQVTRKETKKSGKGGGGGGKLKPHQRKNPPHSSKLPAPGGSATFAASWSFSSEARKIHEAHAAEVLAIPIAQLYKRWASGALVDEHLEDQLVIWQALTDQWSYVSHQPPLSVSSNPLSTSTSTTPPPPDGNNTSVKNPPPESTIHTQTAQWVAGLVALTKFTTSPPWGGDGLVKGVFGCGLKAGDERPEWGRRNRDEELGWLPGAEVGDGPEVRVPVEEDERWVKWVEGRMEGEEAEAEVAAEVEEQK
ncbi:hypothetical protein DFH27DRAFT_563138 [Peziza echinospora]|nr:hypothetical protein DFH27DRAFT_563138 [Peziza echinospora]